MMVVAMMIRWMMMMSRCRFDSALIGCGDVPVPCVGVFETGGDSCTLTRQWAVLARVTEKLNI